MPPAEERTRRKRQLIFFDPVTQLTQEDLQRQIDNPQFETRSLPLPPASPRRRHSAAELLSNPCNCQSHPHIRTYMHMGVCVSHPEMIICELKEHYSIITDGSVVMTTE